MPLLVVHGAKIGCTGCPGAQSHLLVTSSTGVSSTQMCLAAASVTNHVPFVNIVPFPRCSFRFGNPCIPTTPQLWTAGVMTGASFLGISPVLTDAHTLNCTQGGLISISDPGQQTVEIGDIVEPEPEAEEAEDEPGFFDKLWDDGGLLIDVAIVAHLRRRCPG